MTRGTDVNFGQLTRSMIAALSAQPAVDVKLAHEIVDIQRDVEKKEWVLAVRDVATGTVRIVRAPFVFIGAGGYSLSLLEQTRIPEAQGYGAFPVSGQWLRCTNRDVIERHHAKVYGKAAVGSPPMSVPHLDLRVEDGAGSLMFGPYAGFSPKFLKHGSLLDLFASVRWHNVIPMVAAGSSLADALVEMTHKGLGMTGVVDAEGRLIGVFTDGDLRRTLDDAQIELRDVTVDAVMTPHAKTIRPDKLAVEAAKLMEDHRINALLVVDASDRLVGALNIHDLLRAGVV
jgi:hypothetical protein